MRITPDARHVSQRLSQPYLQQATGDGATTVFYLTKAPTISGGLMVYEDGLARTPDLNGTANDYSVAGNKITFAVAPAAAAKLLFHVFSV